MRAVRKRVKWLVVDRKISVSSRAIAIVKMNMAGPTLVIPVSTLSSAASAGSAINGRLESRVLKIRIMA